MSSPEPVDDRDDPVRLSATEDPWANARSTLDGLDEDHRAVLALRFIEGLDYPSMALRLGVPTDTVRSRLSRQGEALRSRFRSGIEDGLV
ncbi:sigma factor-like helix-turn-helix DNA-binding protein [Aquisphaera insulae]|uniref:sigma factor-like helix-turn-helix DNA-binding protein n=1 Tax=Aquisphaera insulae TaxID=2712864 RepID=UPI0013ED78F4